MTNNHFLCICLCARANERFDPTNTRQLNVNVQAPKITRVTLINATSLRPSKTYSTQPQSSLAVWSDFSRENNCLTTPVLNGCT